MTITYEQISAFEAGLVREEAAISTVKRYTGIIHEFALYLGERVEDRFSNLAGSLRVNAAMLTGTGEKILGMLRMYSANF